jgi:hypothetical protein
MQESRVTLTVSARTANDEVAPAETIVSPDISKREQPLSFAAHTLRYLLTDFAIFA